MSKIYVVAQSGHNPKYGISSGPVWASANKEQAVANYRTAIEICRKVSKDNGFRGDPIRETVLDGGSGFNADAVCKYRDGSQTIVSLRQVWVD